jgi:hypothetical protein
LELGAWSLHDSDPTSSLQYDTYYYYYGMIRKIIYIPLPAS